jgi:hypothetical protein
MVHPWVIEHVYLFNARELFEKLRKRGVKIGVATSVAQVYWKEAEIYPKQENVVLRLTDETRRMLALFGSKP